MDAVLHFMGEHIIIFIVLTALAWLSFSAYVLFLWLRKRVFAKRVKKEWPIKEVIGRWRKIRKIRRQREARERRSQRRKLRKPGQD